MLDLGGRNRCYMVKKNARTVVFLQLEKELETTFPLKAEQIEIFDLMGNPYPMKKGDKGYIKVALGNAPVYIVSKGKTSPKEMKEALLKTDFNTTVLKVSGPRLGLDSAGNPALICRVFNEGAIRGLSGEVKLTELPPGFKTEKTSRSFNDISLRSDESIVFPLEFFSPAARNPVKAEVIASRAEKEISADIQVMKSMEAKSAIVIDGSKKDWPASLPCIQMDSFDDVNLVIQGTPWENPFDCSAKLYSQWDKENLYFLAVVQDENVMMDSDIKKKVEENIDSLFNSDCVELFFDTNLMKDFYMKRVNQDEFQFVFSPALKDGTPCRISVPAGNTGLAQEYYKWKPESRIQAKSSLTEKGYIIEIKIPFKTFGEVPLYDKKMIGFNFAVGDDDTEGASVLAYSSRKAPGRDIQMKWSGKGLANPPTGFGVLYFESGK
jgi:hypothetical protein